MGLRSTSKYRLLSVVVAISGDNDREYFLGEVQIEALDEQDRI